MRRWSKKMLTEPAVKAEYDAQAEEFALLDELLRARRRRPDSSGSRGEDGHPDTRRGSLGSGRREPAALAVDCHTPKVRRGGRVPVGDSFAVPAEAIDRCGVIRCRFIIPSITSGWSEPAAWAAELVVSPEPSGSSTREGSNMNEGDTRRELFAAIGSLAEVVPEMRGGATGGRTGGVVPTSTDAGCGMPPTPSLSRPPGDSAAISRRRRPIRAVAGPGLAPGGPGLPRRLT